MKPIINEPNMVDIKASINKAGGLFYQYRPCRKNASTIYDVENIRHNVLYAQTPLNMNDPFDSLIGFSSDKIYENCIDMILSCYDVDINLRLIISVILKYQMLGLIYEFIKVLNQLSSYIRKKRKEMHMMSIPFSTFVSNATKKYMEKHQRRSKPFFLKNFLQLLDVFWIHLRKIQ